MSAEFNTIDEIVDDLINNRLPKKEKQFLASDETSSVESISVGIEFGRWIRNFYGLWHTSPLTLRWRNSGPSDMRHDVDYSYDHPDNITGVIIDRLKERLRAEVSHSPD